MNLSGRARVTIVVLGVVGVLVYLIVVDLGLSAGRIHRGVDVKGVNVGGLTLNEAYEKLAPIGEELAGGALIFVSPVAGEHCRALPDTIQDGPGGEERKVLLGWNPRPFNTARKAYEVGRTGPITGLRDRIRAWIAGVTIGWDDEPDRAKVDAFVDSCAAMGERAGVAVDTDALTEQVVDLVGRWPYEQSHPLPVSDP